MIRYALQKNLWEKLVPTKLDRWLPAREQMIHATQLNFTLPPAMVVRLRAAEEAYAQAAVQAAAQEKAQANVEPEDVDTADSELEPIAYPEPFVVPVTPLDITMRQGMGMVVLMAVLAGLVPFFVNWITAAGVGTALPIANWARFAVRLGEAAPFATSAGAVVSETAQSVAGLPTILPAWLAAGLSSFGAWITWSLRWLAVWIIYGSGALTAAHMLGSTATLQRFYAATSYAAVPLLLVGLAPIPCVGTIAGVIGLVWAAVVYIFAARIVTGLDTGRTILAVVLPAAFAALALVLLSAASALLMV